MNQDNMAASGVMIDGPAKVHPLQEHLDYLTSEGRVNKAILKDIGLWEGAGAVSARAVLKATCKDFEEECRSLVDIFIVSKLTQWTPDHQFICEVNKPLPCNDMWECVYVALKNDGSVVMYLDESMEGSYCTFTLLPPEYRAKDYETAQQDVLQAIRDSDNWEVTE